MQNGSEVKPPDFYALPGARRHYGVSRPVSVRHIGLVLVPDLAERTLHGICTLTLAPFAPAGPAVARLDLDAVDMHVERVEDAAGPLEFVHHDGTLTIVPRAPLLPGGAYTVVVTYRVQRPRRGLFFSGDENAAATQCWTHGHAGGARYWFPCIDEPQQRQSSSTSIDVPLGLFALANGTLVERRDDAATGRTRFRYEQREPHASYLFTFVVGAFVELLQNAGGIPVYAYVSPGREVDARVAFEATPRMLTVLERFTGRPYPYPRYSQIAVADFIFTGMENTTATTLTDEWLADEPGRLTHRGDWLVMHELAHQWFGDFIATTRWPDLWLNEGFASYCEAVWEEAERGWDAYLYHIFCQAKAYFKEVRRSYARPIVCDCFRDPIDLFDRHAYEKASVVLHMLRGMLGDDGFGRAIRSYVRASAGKPVETIDFVRALESATGRNLRGFFAQWLERGGHPVVEVTFAYDENARTARLRVHQQQPVDDTHPAYRFTLVLGLLDRPPTAALQRHDGAPLPSERRVVCDVDAADVSFSIDMERPPALVRIDPGAWTLGEFAFDCGPSLACATLAYDPDPIARIRAAQSLAKSGSARTRAALEAALDGDRFWGARVEYAELLGDACEPWARDALLRALEDIDANVRKAVCKALGRYSEPDVARALHARVRHDGAVEVVGAALHALGKTRDSEAAAVCRAALARASWRDAIGRGALLGLAETDADGALASILAESTGGRPERRRRSAVEALAVRGVRDLGERGLVLSRLSEILDAADAALRQAAIEALEEVNDPAAIPALERLAAREPYPYVARNAARAVLRLQAVAREAQAGGGHAAVRVPDGP